MPSHRIYNNSKNSIPTFFNLIGKIELEQKSKFWSTGAKYFLVTIIATIFIPLTFIAGIYGMNFENMPELKFRYGYFILLGAMFLAFLAMAYFFRRKKWR